VTEIIMAAQVAANLPKMEVVHSHLEQAATPLPAQAALVAVQHKMAPMDHNIKVVQEEVIADR
jgi:hypothetical protein